MSFGPFYFERRRRIKCKCMSRGGFIYKSLITLLQITVLTATYQKNFQIIVIDIAY
jgi:hypothetical protein